MVATAAAVTISGFARGKAPEPRRYLAVGVVFVGLSALAVPAPRLAGGLAGLVFAGVLVNSVTGEQAASSVVRAVTSRGPITPRDARPVATPSVAGGSAPATNLPVPGANQPGIGTPRSSPTPAPPGKVVYPGAARLPLIGRPNQGTHTLGDWQSDNAVDIPFPVGSPIFATESGVIGGPVGPITSSTSSRFAGQRFTLRADSGRSWWYGHLSQLFVREGQRVRAGQLVGLGGSANGVAHLHLGVTIPNDPVRLLGY